jgi:hypothetical protein
MSDNVEGVNNMSKKLFGTPSNVCFNHATGNDFHVHVLCMYLPMLPAGIPAASYKHIPYFDGNRKAYDAFYDLQVDIGEIGVESFATMAQTMMVEYVREHYGDKPANWAEEYWTGERGRICICHARYSGCNNNMGVEVGFRDIKAVTPSNAGIGTFIGGLVHYMKEKGKEGERLMIENGTPDAFIKSPVATKAMWDLVQGKHRKTLRVSFVLGKSKHSRELDQKFRDMADAIAAEGDDDTPLHLKIRSWHESDGCPAHTYLADFKSILIPSQGLLRKLDPKEDMDNTELGPILDELHQKWVRMVIDDERPDDMTVVEALELYKSFHWVRRAPDWGAVPLSCTCPTGYAHALCSETLLVASMFDPSIRVPDDWIGATPALRKQCKSMRGTAGRKRARIAQEIAASKKKVRESYLPFLRCPQTVADAASAFANLSSSDSDHTQV